MNVPLRIRDASLVVLFAGMLGVGAVWYSGELLSGQRGSPTSPPSSPRSPSSAALGLPAEVAREAFETVRDLQEDVDLSGFHVITLEGEGPEVRALVARPEGEGPFPAVILNHGGFHGFSSSFLQAARQWLAAGYAVAASEYRGEGDSAGSADYGGAEVEDVLRLIAWARNRPEVDDDRIAMVGYSRGGTVALLAAARGAPVQAVVVYSPVTDMAAMLQGSERVREILARQDLEFDHRDEEQVRRRSPVHHVEEIHVPVLLLHGGRDPLIPAEQSARFAAALREAGGTANLRVFPEAVHHLKHYPGAFEAARRFLDDHLDGGDPSWMRILKDQDLPLPPRQPYRGVRHGGIYQRMSYKDMTKSLRDNLDHPLLAGIDFNVAWAIVEAEPDRYDWSWVDEPLEIWGSAGKRCAINVITIHPRGVSPVAGHATPEWVFERGAKRVTVETRGKGRTAGMTADYQLLWDPVYLREYEDFIAAFAERYDGHPALDVVGIGVAKLGGLTVIDTKISGDERRALLDLYDENGYSPERYFETIKQIVGIYKRHFRKTPVRLNISQFFDKEDNSPANMARFAMVGDWAASQGVHLFYQGVTGGEKYIRKMDRKRIDEIFHRNADDVLTGLEPVHRIAKGPTHFIGTIEENVDHALGLTPGLDRTWISWLSLYRMDISFSNPMSSSFDGRWHRAVLKAYDHLRMVPPPAAPDPPVEP